MKRKQEQQFNICTKHGAPIFLSDEILSFRQYQQKILNTETELKITATIEKEECTIQAVKNKEEWEKEIKQKLKKKELQNGCENSLRHWEQLLFQAKRNTKPKDKEEATEQLETFHKKYVLALSGLITARAVFCVAQHVCKEAVGKINKNEKIKEVCKIILENTEPTEREKVVLRLRYQLLQQPASKEEVIMKEFVKKYKWINQCPGTSTLLTNTDIKRWKKEWGKTKKEQEESIKEEEKWNKKRKQQQIYYSKKINPSAGAQKTIESTQELGRSINKAEFYQTEALMYYRQYVKECAKYKKVKVGELQQLQFHEVLEFLYSKKRVVPKKKRIEIVM